MIRYLSVCSGIEAATVAWHPLGWQAVAFAEVDAYPSAVLAHHYPHVPNYGDMTRFREWPDAALDLLVGGTPCQSFSVAGLRKGLDDPRGSLMLTYLAVARRYRPRWVVWENVPGVLSVDDGRAFGSLLGGLAELGYGFAYRVLDAQHFGVPQQRRRVFVVGCSRGWRHSAAVLFERESLSWVPPQVADDSVSDRAWWAGEARVLKCIDACYGRKWGSNQWYASGHVIVGSDGRPRRATVLEVERCFGFPDDYTAVPESALREVRRRQAAGRVSSPATRAAGAPFVVQDVRERSAEGIEAGERAASCHVPALGARLSRADIVADGPRYKALGNSMAVPVMRWIGERIQMVDSLDSQDPAQERR